jgi:parallel beta-helix repeat protein
VKKIIVCLIIIILFLLSTQVQSTNNILSPPIKIRYVVKNIDSEYQNIQDAINEANYGDLIFVSEGIYNENIIIKNSIILIGENNNTIIDGNGDGDVILIDAPGVEITGLTIQNSGYSGRDSGVKILADNVIISNNKIINNTIGIFLGSSQNCYIDSNNIYFNRDSGIHILNSNENLIKSNEINDNRWGIFSTLSFNNSIENNIVHSNTLYGIWFLRHNYGNIINNNVISMNKEFGIYFLLLSSYNQIYRNYISSNNFGIYIGNHWPCDGNSIEENTLNQNKDIGVFIQDSSNSIVSRNNFIGNKIHASFNNCQDTIWDYNYWNETRNLPKLIIGKNNMLPWLNFDFHPQSFPYDYNYKRHSFELNNKHNKHDKNEKNYLRNLPSSFGWNDVNGIDYTTPVKNQNPAPTCEAYALCVSLETIAQYNFGYPYGCDLSETHLFFNSGGTSDWGVDIQESVEYLIDYGIPDEGCFPDPHRPYDYPYESVADWENRTIKIKEWGWVENEIESIKHALIEYGPLIICQMTRRDLDYYKSGIYMPKVSSPIQRGHVVAIIGYDDNQRYWTVRNSGGSGWGEDGHFRISYDAFYQNYSFIFPFYGGTGILYIDGLYGNLNPDVPKIDITTPKIFHTYLFGYEINTLIRQISSIQRGAPRIIGSLNISVETSNTNKVEFYLDGDLQYVDQEEPFTWKISASKGLHFLETIAYNDLTISKDIVDIFII